MKRRAVFLPVAWALALAVAPAWPQGRQAPGHSIGSISTEGDLIVMTLNEGALGKANLFDLEGRTLRFTPEKGGYRLENVALQWDSEFGLEMSGPQASLHRFSFPFSGQEFNSFSVGITGSINFAPTATGGRGGRGGGVSVERFAQLQEAGRTLINTVPAICVFFKPRMSGIRYLKELDDRVVLTWSLTEPVGGIQDFTWTPTVNRFQAVLRKDGSIEMSYDRVAARDAIVGVYPLVKTGAEHEIATIAGKEDTSAPPHLSIKAVKLAVVDGLFLKATFETRGPVPAEGSAAIAGIQYRLSFDRQGAPPEAAWTIRGGSGRGGGSRYIAFGPGVSPAVTVSGDSISMQGTLPPGVQEGDRLTMSAEALGPDTSGGGAARISHEVRLTGIHSPELHLSSVKRGDGPFAMAYEAFHYLTLPNPRDMTCTVIPALGDRFDFQVYYSDFRVDNQEAGTPSNGPLGGGPSGGAVTGIHATQRDLEGYCTQGRFQWQFIQPVYAGSNQAQERPPEGITDSNTHNIVAYAHQLGERTPDGKIPPYDYAMSQVGHELGHRWSAFVTAKVNGETIQLGPTHWAAGLQAPAPFPYQRPTEASAMGGGVWQDNYDGTFTQLDDDYYVPATGYSYLDLYLMGLIAPTEVPDFFILRNMVPSGRDRNGHPVVKADRLKVTIEDVIAAEGPRLPDVDHAQKKFNTGIVVMVEHGARPSKELLQRANGIRERWIDYWETVTGHRASMTATPR